MTAGQFEKYQARRVAELLTREEPTKMTKLDEPGDPGQGKKPDWLLEFSSAGPMVVEVTRLAVGTVRQVERFMNTKICRGFTGRLPGSFVLTADIGALADGKIPKQDAQTIVDALDERLRVGCPIESAALPPGIHIERVDASGSVLHPMVLRPALPMTASPDDPEVVELAEKLRSLVEECAAKFADWPNHHRCAVIDISQSGLDWEYHGLQFGGMRHSLLDSLVQRLPQPALRGIDRILLEPGIRVWRAEDAGLELDRRIVAGTRYVDRPLGPFLKVWPGPSRPI